MILGINCATPKIDLRVVPGLQVTRFSLRNGSFDTKYQLCLGRPPYASWSDKIVPIVKNPVNSMNNKEVVPAHLVHIGKKEAPTIKIEGFLIGLKSGNFMPKNYLAGVRGSRTHLPRSSAWHHGILFHLETWLELAEVSTVVRTNSPEMASAIGEFVERMLD